MRHGGSLGQSIPTFVTTKSWKPLTAAKFTVGCMAVGGCTQNGPKSGE
jgi:hypothetical protein